MTPPADAPYLVLDCYERTGPVAFDDLRALSPVAAPVAGVVVKLTEGATGAGSRDGMGPAHVRAARGSGVRLFGCYHFVSRLSSAADQAKNFLDALDAAGLDLSSPDRIDWWPILDLEQSAGGYPSADVALELAQHMEAALGVPSVFYTAGWVTSADGAAVRREFRRYGLWIPAYSSLGPAPCAPWSRLSESEPEIPWLGWQFTGKGRCSGVGAGAQDCDLSCFRQAPPRALADTLPPASGEAM